MDPEIWGNLPLDILEHIAHFADIDSRRAMGFLPRRLVLPDLDLPMALEEYTEFTQGRTRRFKLRNAELYVGRLEIAWVFGTNDFMTSRSYSFRRADGRVTLYALLKMEHSRHPDFNEDGSHKKSVASQPRIQNRSDSYPKQCLPNMVFVSTPAGSSKSCILEKASSHGMQSSRCTTGQ
jgi:hypothetical protein